MSQSPQPSQGQPALDQTVPDQAAQGQQVQEPPRRPGVRPPADIPAAQLASSASPSAVSPAGRHRRQAEEHSDGYNHDHSHSHGHGHGQGHGHSHGHDHGHDHHHSHVPQSPRILLIVLGMTAIIFLAEVIAGVLSGSLALLADSAHMLSDAAGLIVAFAALMIGRKPADARATYGYRRVEVLAALGNAVAVGGISLWILVSAITRLGHPSEITTDVMLPVAVVGLVANIISAVILARNSGDNLNMRGAYLHVLSDLLGSVAVIVAGGVIAVTGWMWADAVASIVIACLIIPPTLKLLRSTLGVLLEHTPTGVDVTAIAQELEKVPGVDHVHDLHVWTIDGQELLATCHVVVANSMTRIRVGDPTIKQAAHEGEIESGAALVRAEQGVRATFREVAAAVEFGEGPAAAEFSEVPAAGGCAVFGTGDCSVLDRTQAVLAGFGIAHSTIQIEAVTHAAHEEICH